MIIANYKYLQLGIVLLDLAKIPCKNLAVAMVVDFAEVIGKINYGKNISKITQGNIKYILFSNQCVCGGEPVDVRWIEMYMGM